MIRWINALLVLLFVGSAGFGYWGIFTQSGRAAYDEMAGIIPFWSICVSLITVSLIVIINMTRYIRKIRSGNGTNS
ncbi:MAG: hypothetical protein KDC45_15990 [Bacteroidetes bacterium]|nr:hypothetical protein [Bacteroidota bacterium]